VQKTAPCVPPPLPHPPRRWALFLDVDGTLTPLAPRPGDVVLGAAVIERLSSLHTAFEDALAVISGRSIPDLDQLLAPLRLPVAGQHGAERRDAEGGVHHADPDAVEALSEAREALARFAADNPGIELQDKRLTLSLHYRRAPHCAQAARRLLRRLEPSLGRRFVVEEGKQVLEVRSRGCNKGSAIRAFLQEAPFGGRRPVFAGDDLTDEDGFRAVNAAGGISIKIGAGPTHARYRLAQPDDMLAWLDTCLQQLDG